MARYLIGRIAGLLVTLFLVSVIAFALMHSIPGGPFDETKMPLPPAARANILAKFGLDQPIHVQYLRYMGSALRGDFGYSYQSPDDTVIELIGRTWPVSMALGGITVVAGLGGGIGLGILAALRRRTWFDTLVTLLSAVALTVPNFVVATWLILVFAVQLRWLPLGGWGDDWRQAVMPALAMGIGPLAIAARYTRASMVEVIDAEHVRTARAKGLTQRMVVARHVLKNALIPVSTVLIPRIPDLLTGTIFIETLFRVPGLGKFFVTSIAQRDYPMIMALVLLVAVVWGVTYLLTDLLYLALDPRIRLA
jgi:ABC-type dipeptide/oligopeptide/nickel transport system permease component